MPRAKGYVDVAYLQQVAELIKPFKERSYALMHITPGARVLDVGCGPATDTIRLAEIVGETGKVVGVDYDTHMVETANERAEKAGVSRYLTHQQADAYTLPFETASFDAVRTERMLQHLQEPERALAEMVRVTKPGGWVAIIDTDWATLSIDSPDTDIERRIVYSIGDSQQYNSYSGRKLSRQIQRAGLQNRIAEAFPGVITNYGAIRYLAHLDEAEEYAVAAGIVTAEEVLRWQAGLEEAEAHACFFCSMSAVLVAGQKPV